VHVLVVSCTFLRFNFFNVIFCTFCFSLHLFVYFVYDFHNTYIASLIWTVLADRLSLSDRCKRLVVASDSVTLSVTYSVVPKVNKLSCSR